MADRGRDLDRLRAMSAPATVAAAGVVSGVLLHLRDPRVVGAWGPTGIGLCPFHAVTGLWCPGCGGTRAMADLVHLDVVAAIGHNVLAVVLAVALAVAWVSWVRRRWRGEGLQRMVVLGPRASVAVMATMAVFMVVRNLAVGAALAP